MHERLWVGKFRAEIEWYEYFAGHPPPVRVPRLIAADSRDCAMLMTKARGDPIARERYISVSVAADQLTTLFVALKALHAWRPRVWIDAAAIRGEYISRLGRYADSGALRLDPSQLEEILDSLSNIAWKFEFNHGDLLFANCLWHRGRITLIDWEYAGYYLPGYDLALLWLLLANDPGARSEIRGKISIEDLQYRRAFAINSLLLLGRETRIHAALDESDYRTQRLEQLGRDLEVAWTDFLTIQSVDGLETVKDKVQ